MAGDLSADESNADHGAMSPQSSTGASRRSAAGSERSNFFDEFPVRAPGATTAIDPLAAVIQRDIVPALLLQFREAAGVQQPDSKIFTAQDRREFASSVLALPAAQLVAITKQFLDTGFSTEQILLKLLTPVARDFGVLWERDELSFVDVTISVQKLQHVLHALSDRDQSVVTSGQRPAAFLVPAPGETHSFGLVMMSEMLRRRGWVVTGGLPMPLVRIVETASMRSFALIGFSISADALIKPVASAIRDVRKRSMNRAVKIIVGGRVCEGKSELASDLGADGAFYDAEHACAFAAALLPATGQVVHP